MIKDLKAGLLVISSLLALVVLVVLVGVVLVSIIAGLGFVMTKLLPEWAYLPFIAICWIFIVLSLVGRSVRS